MRKTFRKIEVYIWALAMILLCSLSIHRSGVIFSDDSYQYLSIAENLRNHGEIATSIVHFDHERASGKLPAPETQFPPGYPAAIDCLVLTHLSPETAAWMVSFISIVSVVPLLWWGTGLAGATLGVRRVAVASWITNSQVIAYAIKINSEGLFTALVFAGVVLLLSSDRSNSRTARSTVPVAMAFIGLSYWVRYAGILIISGLVVYIGWMAVSRNPRFRLWLLSLPICFSVIAFVLVRNSRVAGTWRGGNDLVVQRPWINILRHFAGAVYHLLLGESRDKFSFGVALSVLAFTAVFLVLFRIGSATRKQLLKPSGTSLLFTIMIVYFGGIIYLEAHTMVSFETRYALPLLPEIILLCAAVLTVSWRSVSELRTRRTIPLLAVIAMFAYIFQNAYSLRHTSNVPPHSIIAAYLAEPTPGGGTLNSWIDSNIAKDVPLLASNGQATAYMLHRPVVSMVSERFSSRRWDESEVRQTMSQYRASYLVAYSGLPAVLDPVQEESLFLQKLIAGQHPSWLIPRVQTAHVEIFEFLKDSPGEVRPVTP